MPESSLLSVEVLQLDGSVTVALAGEFDFAAVPLFRETVYPLLARYDAEQIIFDCSRLEFIDSTALGEVVQLTKRAASGKLTLTGASTMLLRLLRLTNWEHLFTVAPAAEEDATKHQALGQGPSEPRWS